MPVTLVTTMRAAFDKAGFVPPFGKNAGMKTVKGWNAAVSFRTYQHLKSKGILE